MRQKIDLYILYKVLHLMRIPKVSYYSQKKLEAMNFKYLGKNVKISTKASLDDYEKFEIGNNIHITPYCLLVEGGEGITLEEGTSIRVMSLVLKNTKPWAICTRIPAKKIENRKKDLLKLEQKHLSIGIR